MSITTYTLKTHSREDVTANYPNLNKCIIHGELPKIQIVVAGRKKEKYFVALCDHEDCNRIAESTDKVVEAWNKWNPNHDQQELQLCMEEMRIAELKESRYNERILKAIKSVKGNDFYSALMDCIEFSEGVKGKLEIVSSPTGNKQDEGDYPPIPNVWVDQYRNGGHTGDDFAGSVCVQLKENKYLKFHFSM